MKMFLLLGQITDQFVLDDIQFMASNRRPAVTLQFADPDCRFYLTSDELVQLERDHPGYFRSSSDPMRVGFEYEPGERLEGLLSVGGREYATVIKVAHHQGYDTSYEVAPDYIPPGPLAVSKWRRCLKRPQAAPPLESVIWPRSTTIFIQRADKSRPVDFDDIDVDYDDHGYY